MAKFTQCDRCLYYANDHHLVCVPHPYGIEGNTCPDFIPNPELQGRRFVDFLGLLQNTENLTSNASFSDPLDLEADEDLWESESRSYYGEELIVQPQVRWTQEEQLELLNVHPLFTSVCPACSRRFPQSEKPLVHWDCECGWIDDTI